VSQVRGCAFELIRYAKASGAAVVLVSSQRCRGGWALRDARFQGEPTPEAVNRAMEDLIGERPAQYLWSYNRFKQPAGAPAADQAARS